MRRADPERIYQAQRAGVVKHLRGASSSSEHAERLVAAWEAEAERRGIPARGHEFWDACEAWIAEQRER
jgi:hypothetical protein